MGLNSCFEADFSDTNLDVFQLSYLLLFNKNDILVSSRRLCFSLFALGQQGKQISYVLNGYLAYVLCEVYCIFLTFLYALAYLKSKRIAVFVNCIFTV